MADYSSPHRNHHSRDLTMNDLMPNTVEGSDCFVVPVIPGRARYGRCDDLPSKGAAGAYDLSAGVRGTQPIARVTVDRRAIHLPWNRPTVGKLRGEGARRAGRSPMLPEHRFPWVRDKLWER